MAIVSCNAITTSLSVDSERHRNYTSIYQVITDSVNDGPRTVVEASCIPDWGDPYVWNLVTGDIDNWAFCSGYEVGMPIVRDTRRLWEVIVRHSSRPGFINPRDHATARENPVDEPALLSGSFVGHRRVMRADKDGNAISNTVGEPFIPGIEMDDATLSLIIEKNSSTIALDQWAGFRNAVNSVPIWGLDSRTVKLQQWSWRVHYFAVSNAYIANRMEFEINTDTYDAEETGRGWDFNILNAGYRHRIDCNADKEKRVREIMDGIDQPRHLPTPLDANGAILDLGCGDDPYYKNFRGYREKDFHAIPWLPDPLPGPFV